MGMRHVEDIMGDRFYPIAAPSPLGEGHVYYDSTNHSLYFYRGGTSPAWVDVAAGIPDASATVSGQVNITTQTFGGYKTFNNGAHIYHPTLGNVDIGVSGFATLYAYAESAFKVVSGINVAAGSGIYGESAYGWGGEFAGATGVHAQGTLYGVNATTNSGTGVSGTYTGSGAGYGIWGSAASTTFGAGVYGTSGYRGVWGNSTSIAVVGEGGITGVYGSGSTYGIEGVSTAMAVKGSGGTQGVYGNGSTNGVHGETTSGVGVRATGGSGNGVEGYAGITTMPGIAGVGVYGAGSTRGVQGQSTSGVGGYFAGVTGVQGMTSTAAGIGVVGENTNNTAGAVNFGVSGAANGAGTGFRIGIKGSASNASATCYGVEGYSTTGMGVYGWGNGITGVVGMGGSLTSANLPTSKFGVYGASNSTDGIQGRTSATAACGVSGYYDGTGTSGKGVYGNGGTAIGVYGTSSHEGIRGESSYIGVHGITTSGWAIMADATAGGLALSAAAAGGGDTIKAINTGAGKGIEVDTSGTGSGVGVYIQGNATATALEVHGLSLIPATFIGGHSSTTGGSTVTVNNTGSVGMGMKITTNNPRTALTLVSTYGGGSGYADAILNMGICRPFANNAGTNHPQYSVWDLPNNGVGGAGAHPGDMFIASDNHSGSGTVYNNQHYLVICVDDWDTNGPGGVMVPTWKFIPLQAITTPPWKSSWP